MRGYFIWSLLDKVKWGDGLHDGFGLFQVERLSLARFAEQSVPWFGVHTGVESVRPRQNGGGMRAAYDVTHTQVVIAVALIAVTVPCLRNLATRCYKRVCGSN